MKRHKADREEHLGDAVDLTDAVDTCLLAASTQLICDAARDAMPQLRHTVPTAIDAAVLWQRQVREQVREHISNEQDRQTMKL